MRKRFNTIVVDEARGEARLLWVEPEEIVTIAAFEAPFLITHEGKCVDVEIVVEDDVREFAFRPRQN